MRATPRPFRREGFAVVTALLILAAVGIVATGAFFLTSTNLQLAQNTRTQAVAKYTAEQWLDVALIVIADGYVALGRLPTRSEIQPFLIPDAGYEITRYGLTADGAVGEVQVTGRALRGDAGAAIARHPVSARFTGVTGPGASPAGPGFITPGHIEVEGASTLLLNMHAGRSLSVAGNVATGDPALGQLFSYMSGSGACSLGTVGSCLTDQPPPHVVALDWQAAYDAAFAEHCAARTVEPVPSGTRTLATVAPGATICLPTSGHFVITGLSPLRNVTIVGGRDTVVTLEAATAGSVDGSNDLGVRLIAGDVRLRPGQALSDRNVIIARGNVVLDRDVTRATVEAVDVDGVRRTRTYVKTLIKAGNDVVFTGSGTSGTYAQVHANGKFCRSGNGGARFIGTITAGAGTPLGTNLTSPDTCAANRADIDFRGGGGWTASLPDGFDVDEPPATRPIGITVLSRRP
jgi:hypothetical protein